MLESNELLKLFSQGLPIVLLICYLLFPDIFVRLSNRPLGKIIAVFLICIYTYQDMIHGLLLCLLIILYYNQELESFISKSGVDYANYLPKPSRKDGQSKYENHLEKDFTSVDEAYPDNIAPVKKVSEAIFRKEKCMKSKVQCKNQNLKNNIVTHVYPELQFSQEICNPCDRTCHFTITKQNIETSLKPKDAKLTMYDDVKELFGFQKEEPFVTNNLVVSEYQ